MLRPLSGRDLKSTEDDCCNVIAMRLCEQMLKAAINAEEEPMLCIDLSYIILTRYHLVVSAALPTATQLIQGRHDSLPSIFEPCKSINRCSKR